MHFQTNPWLVWCYTPFLFVLCASLLASLIHYTLHWKLLSVLYIQFLSSSIVLIFYTTSLQINQTRCRNMVDQPSLCIYCQNLLVTNYADELNNFGTNLSPLSFTYRFFILNFIVPPNFQPLLYRFGELWSSLFFSNFLLSMFHFYKSYSMLIFSEISFWP